MIRVLDDVTYTVSTPFKENNQNTEIHDAVNLAVMVYSSASRVDVCALAAATGDCGDQLMSGDSLPLVQPRNQTTHFLMQATHDVT